MGGGGETDRPEGDERFQEGGWRLEGGEMRRKMEGYIFFYLPLRGLDKGEVVEAGQVVGV